MNNAVEFIRQSERKNFGISISTLLYKIINRVCSILTKIYSIEFNAVFPLSGQIFQYSQRLVAICIMYCLQQLKLL